MKKQFVIANRKQIDKHAKLERQINLDSTVLNQAIARKLLHYRMPNDIFYKLLQAKMF